MALTERAGAHLSMGFNAYITANGVTASTLRQTIIASVASYCGI